jgi:hypothetical protein
MMKRGKTKAVQPEFMAKVWRISGDLLAHHCPPICRCNLTQSKGLFSG